MAAPPNWYPDPEDPKNKVRYWTGAKWTHDSKVNATTASFTPPKAPTSDAPTKKVTPLRGARFAPLDIEESIIKDDELSILQDTKPEDNYSDTRFSMNSQPETPYTVAQLKRRLKQGIINRSQFKIQRREAEKRLSNTRFTSRGGFAFSIYLLAYPVIIGVGVYFLGLTITDIATSLTSIDFTKDPAGSIKIIQSMTDLAPEYTTFRNNFIITVMTSAIVPLILGIVGSFRKKGRVWAIATILLSLVFNPTVVTFGALTNLSWVVIFFGF